MDKCKASANQTLGPMITDSIKSNAIPANLHEYFEHGFLVGRNQSGHVWKDTSGKALSVDAETVNHAFAAIDALFEEFYVGPARMAAHVAKMKVVKSQKA